MINKIKKKSHKSCKSYNHASHAQKEVSLKVFK